MYLGTTITGILLVVACTMPVVIGNRNRAKRIKRFYDLLKDYALKFDAQIDTHDVWNGTVIGVDKIKFKLFYIQTNETSQLEIQTDLKLIRKCRVDKKSRTVKNGSDTITVIERLDLCLTFADSTKTDLLLPFYNNNRDNLSIDRELELVNKWSALINTLLDEQKTKSQRHF